ncbi:MAG: 50S ribosomal protein L3 N(5)-glutamine methyltransferase [Gammaproteobacteria bacterium]|nr:MAG: 50S ribosomal protein L3 N(5)-glutamine methyltransferase [Gammaproteobacteria bacterium]
MNTDNSLQTLYQAIEYCAQALADSGVFFGHGTDNPWDEAVQLVLFACDEPQNLAAEQAQRRLSERELNDIQQLLRERVVDGKPLPYLTGRAYFAGLEFIADERALVPRSPIAELIEQQFYPWWIAPEGEARILDLCCGGGSIGIACAVYIDAARVDLADIDRDALALADENIAYHGVADRVRTVHSNGFAALTDQRYDLIVCNPPYVNALDLADMPREYQHEPAIALGSGADGLDFTRQLLAEVKNHLTPKGTLILEVGNSWPALEAAFPTLPFLWIELERGGHGVCALQAAQL